LTLGCGTLGGNITSDNITPLHLLHIKRVAAGRAEAQAGPAELSPAGAAEGDRKPFGGVSPDLVERVVEEVLRELERGGS
jgi:hypothetical protein